jgi:LAS superfamily LD-carboxypeptidase LdcB
VASSIAGQLGNLLSAASAAGLHLGGGGYRDSSSQIALRRAHCGTSPYAIYEMPASQCHPPTAPPGQSMHEQGLAIDFTNNGSLINSHSDPAWQWLSANAGRFGLRNLPSEPWHWSTNGN